MKKYSVTLRGITPYMQHRMDDIKLEDWEKKHGIIIDRPDLSHSDQVRAEYHCYRNSGGQCFIPSEHFRQSFIGAGAMVKSKVGNSRKSMKNIVAAMFTIASDELIIGEFDQIDKRSAVNKNVKARIIVIRPKWTSWKVTFDLLVDNDTITIETVREIISHAGNFIGIGSYRPTNNGQFGRFEIISLTLS